MLARARAHATVPVAVGFGIGKPDQAAAAAAAGADGVIVGSRLVRAAGEEADPGPQPVGWCARSPMRSRPVGRARLPASISRPWA